MSLERLRTIRGFLLDMDGTFYLGNKILPGSLLFLDELQNRHKEAVFLTNNSSHSIKYYTQKLSRMQVRKPFLRVVSSSQAAARHIHTHYHDKRGFLLGNLQIRRELTDSGLVFSDQSPDYVLVCYDTTLTYRRLSVVCELIRSGLPFIATHPDLNCPTESGYAPDIGAILAFIKASTGRSPDVILGKPYEGIVEEAFKVTGLDAQETAIVGDRLYTDITAGVRFSMLSVLVLSGETTLLDLQHSSIKPDLVFNGLADMIPYLS